MKSGALVQVTGIRRALTEAKTLPQVKSLEARAKAVRDVLKAEGVGVREINMIAELLLLTRKKGGWLCDGIPAHRPKKSTTPRRTSSRRRP